MSDECVTRGSANDCVTWCRWAGPRGIRPIVAFRLRFSGCAWEMRFERLRGGPAEQSRGSTTIATGMFCRSDIVDNLEQLLRLGTRMAYDDLRPSMMGCAMSRNEPVGLADEAMCRKGKAVCGRQGRR